MSEIRIKLELPHQEKCLVSWFTERGITGISNSYNAYVLAAAGTVDKHMLQYAALTANNNPNISEVTTMHYALRYWQYKAI